MIKFNHFFVTFVVGSVILLWSCSTSKPEALVTDIPPNTYVPTDLPADTTKLWIGDGDIASDTILIIGEGGPKNHLYFESTGRAYWEYLPSHTAYYFAIIHQSSSYNRTIFASSNFSHSDADFEVDNSSEILYRAIKYFKDRGKYVVVFGHSYSAFIIPHYLSTRPNEADKYVITGGRLDADSVQTAYQLKGINTGFESDGKTLILPDENDQPNPYRRQRYHTIRSNKEKLKHAIGKCRYTKELNDTDLSNVVFCYGLKDENVGALSESELLFLQSKKAEVHAFDEDHYNIWKRVIDAFRDQQLQL